MSRSRIGIVAVGVVLDVTPLHPRRSCGSSLDKTACQVHVIVHREDWRFQMSIPVWVAEHVHRLPATLHQLNLFLDGHVELRGNT
jgi:hypothetical protein